MLKYDYNAYKKSFYDESLFVSVIDKKGIIQYIGISHFNLSTIGFKHSILQ